MDKTKLLLVEDDPDFRSALELRLKKRGFEVTVTASGEEAMDKLKSSVFDIVVSDIRLPGMSGMKFLDKVKKINEYLPVILLTGYGSLETAKEAVRLKATDYLLKPLDSIDELLHPINKALYSYNLIKENERLSDDLKLKIEELGRSEQRYKDLFESASDIIFTADIKGMITAVNKTMERITGYKKTELIGKIFSKAIVPIETEKLINPGKLMSEKSAGLIEVKIITKEDKVRLGEMGMRLLREEDKITGAQYIVRDITERKKAENELKNSELKLMRQKEILEKKNIALREILEQVEIEKKRIKDNVLANVDRLLMPSLKRLRKRLKSFDARYVDILQKNLEQLTSSFGRKLTEKKLLQLTPREIEICDMIRNGFSSKEISELLNISLPTTERHRNNIRRKLGIVNKNLNLITYLQTP